MPGEVIYTGLFHPSLLYNLCTLVIDSEPDYSAGKGNVQKETGEDNGNPLQYSCLENPMDGGAWSAAVHGVAESWTKLSD